MYKDVLRAIDNIEMFPVISLIIFVGFFAFVLYGTYKTSNARIAEMSNMPLDDNDSTLTNDKNTQPC